MNIKLELSCNSIEILERLPKPCSLKSRLVCDKICDGHLNVNKLQHKKLFQLHEILWPLLWNSKVKDIMLDARKKRIVNWTRSVNEEDLRKVIHWHRTCSRAQLPRRYNSVGCLLKVKCVWGPEWIMLSLCWSHRDAQISIQL